MVALGGGDVSYDRGTPVLACVPCSSPFQWSRGEREGEREKGREGERERERERGRERELKYKIVFRDHYRGLITPLVFPLRGGRACAVFWRKRGRGSCDRSQAS